MQKEFVLCLLLPFVCSSCMVADSRTNDSESDEKITLQFEELMFFWPTGNFFEIHINMADKNNRFSKPQTINIAQVVSVEKQYENINDAFPVTKTGKLVLCDISPDKKWDVLRVIDSTYNKYARLDHFLYNTDDNTVETLPISEFQNILFSLDSNSFYFIRNWHLMKYNFIKNKEIDCEQEATSFFLSPDRTRIITFNNKKICSMAVDKSLTKEIGSYKYVVVDSGLINSKYAYFITAFSNKGGPKYLHVMNLETLDIVKCPFSIPEGAVISKYLM